MDLQLLYIIGVAIVAHLLLTIAAVSLVLIIYDRWLRDSRVVPVLVIAAGAATVVLVGMFFVVQMWRF